MSHHTGRQLCWPASRLLFFISTLLVLPIEITFQHIAINPHLNTETVEAVTEGVQVVFIDPAVRNVFSQSAVRIHVPVDSLFGISLRP